jgi:nitrite reductase (NADH) small subunit
MATQSAPPSASATDRRRYVVCKAHELAPGERLIVDLNGRSVGVFNIADRFYALHNRCPHAGGALCRGPLTGTALPTNQREYVYGLEGRILRCAWHGWEFEVETGRCLADPRMKARTYPVTVEDGEVIVHI